MNRIFHVLMILTLFLGAPVAVEVSAEDTDVIRFGISTRTLPGLNLNDATSALKVYAQTIFNEQKLKGSADIKIVASLPEIQSALANNQLDIIAVTAEDLLLLGVQPESVFIHSTDAGYLVRYVLVVHRSSGRTNLRDLKGKTLTVSQTRDMSLADIWLDNLLQESVSDSADDWFGNRMMMDNPAKAALRIFFRQADVALLTRDALDLAGELNPQLKNDLVVLYESPPFVSSFFFFRPAWQGSARDSLEAAFEKVHLNPAGLQVLTAFQISHFEKKPGSVLDETLAFLLRHRRIQDSLPAEKGLRK